jgi:hypothetical protein
MPTATTLTPERIDEWFDEADITTEDNDSASPPDFDLNLNTQNADIRALRETYPPIMFQHDYQQSVVTALDHERQYARSAIMDIRRARLLHRLSKELASPREQKIFKRVALSVLPIQSWQRIERATDVNESGYVISKKAAIEEYLAKRRDWFEARAKYAPLQARFNQQAALIRQRPSEHVRLNGSGILATLASWENVFAVAVKYSAADAQYDIRVGLCDIVMDESAEKSRYDIPASIPLAPFYFTIRLSENGRFTCPTQNRYVGGLVRHYPNQLSGYVHPHQLSDQPCFGSFTQTLVDLAASGQIIPLVSTIIAFYSQYNSEDSAGVSARYFYPNEGNPDHIVLPADPTSFMDDLIFAFTEWSRWCICDEEKLEAAYERYEAFMNNPPHPAPIIVSEVVCSWCEEVDVSDSAEFYLDYFGDRVCPDCWYEHYCSNCERPTDSCNCPEE